MSAHDAADVTPMRVSPTTISTAELPASEVAPSASDRPQRRSPSRLGLLRDRRVLFGVLLLVLVVGATVLAPVVSPANPDEQQLLEKLLPPAWTSGKWAHPLGTDHLGRDMLSRILFGGRISLLVGGLAVILSGSIGVALGLISGLYGGRIDAVIGRIAEVQLAFPQVLLVILVLVLLGQSLASIVVVLALSDWVVYCRLIRGRTLVEKQREYVEAARATGATDGRILLRHLLPNISSLMIVVATAQLGHMILLESSLSYLGVGVQPPTSSWGRMLNDGQQYMPIAWWVSTLPGLAIVLAVLGINFLADGLRERSS